MKRHLFSSYEAPDRVIICPKCNRVTSLHLKARFPEEIKEYEFCDKCKKEMLEGESLAKKYLGVNKRGGR